MDAEDQQVIDAGRHGGLLQGDGGDRAGNDGNAAEPVPAGLAGGAPTVGAMSGGRGTMEIGVFIPIGNNGWLISENAPQYMPSFELNRNVVQKAEGYGFDFALSMIKLR